MKIKHWQYLIHTNARAHGWWDGESDNWFQRLMVKIGIRRPAPERNIPEVLALIHSEVSEALEAYRVGDMSFRITKGGKPDGFPVELADIVIRVLDLAQFQGIDIERMMRAKHYYNIKRPLRHGGKRA